MADQIKWSPKAASHLEEICEHIAKDSPFYASVFAKRLLSLVQSLPKFPKSGRIVPEYNKDDLREKIYDNYRLVYRLRQDLIEIVAICHGARRLENVL